MEALETSFGKGYYVDKVIERILKSNRKWGARDRGFIAESTYEIVRWWRLLWAIYGKEPTLKRKELYRLFGVWWLWQGNSLPDWNHFAALEDFDLDKALAAVPKDIRYRQSFPDWLDELARQELGSEKWSEIAQNLNLQASVILRTNNLLTKRDELSVRMLQDGIDTEELQANDVGLILKKRANTFRTPSFQDGWFEVQDGGSQQIAPFLNPEPGMRVIDACAGAGGKTLHLAAMMENKGSIIAMDVEARKLHELKKRARRNQVHNVETRLIDSSKVIKRLAGTADRLLLDVPCSGTGVIKRNPDTKWKLQPEHVEKVQHIQARIIRDYSETLKPGGRMVYATCSILKSENEEQVRKFLDENTDFKLLDEKRLDPGPESDGFYMALLEKCEY